MGRATRWLKGLLGMKNNSNSNKEKENQYPSKPSPTTINIDTDDYKREKGRWSFAKSASRDGGDGAAALRQIPVNIPVDRRDTDTAAWYKNYVADGEEEQSKHAIAVAAATAAAADAAVAAAQAAVAVVRLTSRGAVFNGSRERWAAVKIQTVFRGFLSRKALKALKALVKLQAHVRGYLVRKRATATLRGMQALIRVQAAARSQRTRRGDIRLPPEFQPRRSLERFDESRTRSEYPSKRLSATYDHPSPYDACSDNSPKIVEVDTYKPRSASRRSTAPSAAYDSCVHDCGYPTMSSPLPCPAPPRLSMPDYSRNLHDSDWGFYYDDYRTSSAHSTPRFANSSLRSNGPPTPPRSVCGDGFFRRRSCGSNRGPNYMANTQSFRAKSRSQSAPRQRPGTCPSPKKRISLDEIMASRNSVSCVRMQRCSPHFPQGLNF